MMLLAERTEFRERQTVDLCAKINGLLCDLTARLFRRLDDESELWHQNTFSSNRRSFPLLLAVGWTLTSFQLSTLTVSNHDNVT